MNTDPTTLTPGAGRLDGGLWRDAGRHIVASRLTVSAMIILALLVALALAGPYTIAPHRFDYVDWDYIGGPPSFARGYLFGADSIGRDLLPRVFMGLRVSLLVGLVGAGVSLGIGVTYGAIAGYIGGRTDAIMMRAVDILYALPFMFFVIVLMVFFERSLWLVFVAIGAVEWLTLARIVRGQTLSLRRREFIESAVTSGLSTPAILARHIVPNLLGPVIVYATLTIPNVILIESFLSFLGLGVQEPYTSLGVLISEGAADLENSPWMFLFPTAVLAVLLLCFNLLGDGLRDAFDPRRH